ncbi:MAG: aspartate aminotransferase family protein [Candidatus Methylomirabilales bacterium]
MTDERGSKIEALRARDQDSVAPAVYRHTPLAFSRGEGVYLFDLDGRRYLDFAAGIATCNVGHCHPRVVEAIRDQAARLIHPCDHVGLYEAYVQFSERIRSLCPGALREGKVLLVNSGTEAIEGALKLARVATGRQGVIAFLGAFHGRGQGALSVTTSKSAYRRGLAGLLAGTAYALYPGAFPELEGGDALGTALAFLETLTKTVLPPEDLAAVLVEPILGEGGYIVPPDGFLLALRGFCDRHGALLIADEIQTGWARTGRLFAVEHWGVTPDIMTLAKATGGGLPLGAIVARRDVMDRWPPAAHGTTFGGNPVACRAGLATIAVILEEDLAGNAERLGAHVRNALEGTRSRTPALAAVRGKGLMLGAVLRGPSGEPAVSETAAVIAAAAEGGLVLTKCGDNVLRISPPLILTGEQADEGLAILAKALEQVFGDSARARN